ncbi:hypothetical protein [Amphibacillus jilinensis]|uniref:hypothetical protein n=1 Tax=Amphibacillus jilinensis TaxID=1216008 RepID=UPI000364BB93|nr:hypothetical protein [Amphibacillus jilinensis]
MQKKWRLVLLHFWVGIGALAGGTPAMLDPFNPMGMPADALVNGPFNSFLIPGLFLFLVIGGGNIVTGILIMRKWIFYSYTSVLMGVILCLWIIIQCYVLSDVVFLHLLFFVIGAVQVWLGFRYWQAEGRVLISQDIVKLTRIFKNKKNVS